MTSRKRRVFPAIVATALSMGAGMAFGAEPTQDMMAQQAEKIAALEAKLANLEAKQVNASDVDATVESVLRDADQRSQLLATDGGITGGWDDKGPVLRSANGDFSLRPGFQLQVRHNTTTGANPDGGHDDTHNGFEVRRMKFLFSGNAFGPELTYKFQWATDRDGGDVFLEDAYAQYRFADDWFVKVGQFKDPVHHEELTSSGKQLAVERSLVNELIGGGQTDRIQGLFLTYETDQLMFTFGYHDGANSDNTDFTDPGGGAFTNASDYGLSARVEFTAFGQKKSYEDFSAMGNTEDLLVIGAGVDYTEFGNNSAVYHTVDAQWEVGGLGLYGAYYGIWNRAESGVSGFDNDDDSYDFGFLVQAGLMLNDQVELFARYDITFLDNVGGDAFDTDDDDNFNELTVGMNWFWHKHNSKFTADVTWLPDGSPGNITGNGFLSSDDNEFVLRLQYQLMI